MERTGIGMLACKADEHRTIRYVSDSFLEFIGYTREELRTQFNDSFYSLVRREDVAFLRHKLDRQTPMGDEILLEYHLMRKGRGAVQVVERSRLVLEGGVRCSYCEFFDARGPRNVVDSYKRILEAMPAPVVLLDANLRVHFMNRAMEKAVGLELAKCLNLTCAEVFRTPYCNTRDCCCYERYKRNEPFSVRHASDGRIFQVVFSPLKDEAGEVVGIVSVSSDITERCRLEERLREGESRCLVALAQTRNAIWEFDVKTGTLWHLDSELSGYARPFGMESILHDVPESLIQSGRVHSDSVAPLRKMFADIRHGEKKGSCTVKIYTLEGGELWVALTYTTIFNALGGPERAIGLARNVSEEKKREELFAKEREYFTSLLANALAAYEIDLTEDRVLERDSIWPRTDIKEAGGPEVRYSAALEKSVQRLVLPAHRDRVLQTMNPGALIRLYQSGRARPGLNTVARDRAASSYGPNVMRILSSPLSAGTSLPSST